jgi:hypothetical protein
VIVFCIDSADDVMRSVELDLTCCEIHARYEEREDKRSEPGVCGAIIQNLGDGTRLGLHAKGVLSRQEPSVEAQNGSDRIKADVFALGHGRHGAQGA